MLRPRRLGYGSDQDREDEPAVGSGHWVPALLSRGRVSDRGHRGRLSRRPQARWRRRLGAGAVVGPGERSSLPSRGLAGRSC